MALKWQYSSAGRRHLQGRRLAYSLPSSAASLFEETGLRMCVRGCTREISASTPSFFGLSFFAVLISFLSFFLSIFCRPSANPPPSLASASWLSVIFTRCRGSARQIGHAAPTVCRGRPDPIRARVDQPRRSAQFAWVLEHLGEVLSAAAHNATSTCIPLLCHVVLT